MTTTNADYSKTVFLPNTAFSMRGDLVKKEPGILAEWEKMDLYGKILAKRRDSKPFILHDGPPYANGPIHIGTALNKILKDMVVKSHAILGFFTPYVPGWDCHGLPIEQALLKEMKMGKRHIDDIPAFRQKARDFANRFLDIQREGFKRLGVLGAWAAPYITMSKEYEGTVIKAFRELLEKGHIHRDKKTIYWCVSCETALADAEVEYHDHTSPSIYVRFPLETLPEGLPSDAKGRASIVIWTTTPWTLPSNMAAAVSNTEDYRVLETGGQYLLVADKLVEAFLAETRLEAVKGAAIPGEKLVGLKYTHCLAPHLPESRRFPREIIATDFVDMSTGTGVVHIAPGHGEEDFHAGKKHGLDIFCPVKADGTFNADAGIFEGMKVFESNDKVAETLKADGLLLALKKIEHSYPHCWRCKQPVIFRATEQWFLKVDLDGLRGKLLKAADGVRWLPAAGRERMAGMLKTRPDWCLSRQRYWGTPIIAVYCKDCGKVQEDTAFLKRMEERVFREGSDFWFSEPVEKLMEPGCKCSCGGTAFTKEKDIMDVWLDSGVSWYAVLEGGMLGPGKFFPADVYLEGSDQHRGWFQTSLIPSVALRGEPAFKTVITHGMILDDKGRAMHKSAGNAIDPAEIISKYGAEILRLWVALCDYSEDVRISEKILAGAIDTYRKIRNTLRYLLGNLADFKPAAHRVPDAKLLEVDRYMRARLAVTVAAVEKHYANFQFRQAIRAIADFCILDLSAFYLDSLKDRLYTFSPDAPERRSAQTVLHDILLAVTKMMAPVLSFTAEEAWKTAKAEIDPSLEDSVFLSDYPRYDAAWSDPALLARWEGIMAVREVVTKAIEEKRQAGEVGSSLEARIVLRTSEEEKKKFLDSALALWPQVAIVSEAAVEFDAAAPELEVKVFKAEGAKCPRCWQWRRDIGSDQARPDLCGRCAAVVKGANNG
ncbi:MAG: isoleucine--tRNA ligase [Elusimicrobia bacterium GWF2_62_30]|nr:MAG: isoleucine--tRNA ligase [Elusimicrobia bacterium GWF2_62_30]